MANQDEPWATAQLYLDVCGDDAEQQIRRVARELLHEGNVDDAEKLFDVFEAVRVLRHRRATRRFGLH